MFSFGDKDKEKLKENMEQIKEMVDNGDVPEEGSQQPADELNDGMSSENLSDNESLEDDFESQDFSQNDDFDQGWEPAEQNNQSQRSDTGHNNNQTQSTQNFGDEPSSGQPQGSGSEEKLERFEEAAEQKSQSFDEPAQQNQQPQGDSFDQRFGARESDSSNQDNSSRTPSAPSNDNIPKPPETKEIEVPEIEKGPLFLKRQKFRKARQMVEEMRYLSDQIQGTLNSLESGIQEDQNIEKNIRNMLHEFESSREEVQGIISPGEE